jgi:cytosine/adenosine deaminase-related metal-dependent hydrolase
LAPALINSHDHLKYTWPQHIGHPPYNDSLEWLPSLYSTAERTFLNILTLEELYWLGTYKNLLSGVTTVANHSRRLHRAFFAQFPIRILYRFAREIFIRFDDRAHQMGFGPEIELGLARNMNLPFVVHLAEGLNHGTESELELLEKLGGLFDNSVLIHALNISEQEIDKISKAGASVVWCPVSNKFLFRKTAAVGNLVSKGVNVALGTDSTCTGSESLLDEMRAAVSELRMQCLRQTAQLVFSFVTVNAAKAFKESANLGRVRPGALADVLLFDTCNDDPITGLIELRPKDILLLTRGGQWLFGNPPFTRKLGAGHIFHSEVSIDGVSKRIVGSPMDLLNTITKRTGRDLKFFPLGRIMSSS